MCEWCNGLSPVCPKCGGEDYHNNDESFMVVSKCSGEFPTPQIKISVRNINPNTHEFDIYANGKFHNNNKL